MYCLGDLGKNSLPYFWIITSFAALTASVDKFSYGVADRGSSIRIPRFTNRDKRGYLEDRRPASNMDPYLVLSKIAKTTILE